jgi:hypothetical protein
VPSGNLSENIAEYLSKRPIIRRILLFMIPPIIAAFYVLILWFSLPFEASKIILGGMTAYFFPPLGKESVIPLSIIALKSLGYDGIFLNVVLVPFSVAFIDIIVALFLAWNFDLALKIPLLGPWMKKMEDAGRKRMKESRWQGALLFWGIVLFVMVPFQGSGGVAATIIGRMAGMNWKKTVLAISIGAVAGCEAIGIISYYAADALIAVTGGSLFKMLALLIGTILLILLIYWFISNRKYVTDHIRGVKNDNRR